MIDKLWDYYFLGTAQEEYTIGIFACQCCFGPYFVFEGDKLQPVIPLVGAGMVRLGGNRVAACRQFVAFDGGIVVDRPLIILEGLGGVLDTNS